MPGSRKDKSSAKKSSAKKRSGGSSKKTASKPAKRAKAPRSPKRPAAPPVDARSAARPAGASGVGAARAESPAVSDAPPAAGSRGRRRSSTPMDLDFGATEAEGAAPFGAGAFGADDLVRRWTLRGDELRGRLEEHGVADFEYRADLKDQRFVWLDPDGRVVAEARAQLLCTWSTTTNVLSMAWDAARQSPSVSRVSWIRSEHDDTDEEQAWRLAMQAADSAGAEYLYRVPAAHAHYFLALSGLSFAPARETFVPATPVAFVLRGLDETARAVVAGAEPSDVLRGRLLALGRSLVEQARLAYRRSDWVAPLERTGKQLLRLADRVPRGSYVGVLRGDASEWLEPAAGKALVQALALLEDEWRLYEG